MVDHILMAVACVYFLKALGYNVGSSIVDENHLAFAKKFMNNIKIRLFYQLILLQEQLLFLPVARLTDIKDIRPMK